MPAGLLWTVMRSRSDLHGVWFLCQCIHLLLSLYFLVTFNSRVYSLALLTASLAYAIVLYKKYAPLRWTRHYFLVTTTDESFHYFFLCLTFIQYASIVVLPITLLIPLSFYALFHVVTYIRHHILTHPAIRARLSNHTVQKWTSRLVAVSAWQTPPYDGLFYLALLELGTPVHLVLLKLLFPLLPPSSPSSSDDHHPYDDAALSGGVGWWPILISLLFIRARFQSGGIMHDAISVVDTRLLDWTERNPRCPGWIKTLVETLRKLAWMLGRHPNSSPMATRNVGGQRRSGNGKQVGRDGQHSSDDAAGAYRRNSDEIRGR